MCSAYTELEVNEIESDRHGIGESEYFNADSYTKLNVIRVV